MKRRSSSRGSSRSRSRTRKRNHSGSRYSPDRFSPDRVYNRRRASPPSRRAPSPPPHRRPSPPPRRGSPPPKRRYDGYSPTRDADKPFKILCVSALHADAKDDLIKDLLHDEYSKFGVSSVRISHNAGERVAYVLFDSAEDARDAMRSRRRIIVRDKVAVVEPVLDREESRHRRRSRSRSLEYERERYERHYYTRMDPFPRHPMMYERGLPYGPPLVPEFRRELLPLPGLPLHDYLPGLGGLPFAPSMASLYPPRPFVPFTPAYLQPTQFQDKNFPSFMQHIPPEDDPLATRTLFAGNLENSITKEELRRIFAPYGVIEDVDVKRPVPGTGTAYAFVRFKNLDMAHKAKCEISGKIVGKYQIKVGYGKAIPTTRIWVGGLGPWTTVEQLENEFDRFGAIQTLDYVKEENCAYILYDSIDAATTAVKEMRGYRLGGCDNKLRIDFADISTNKVYQPEDYNNSPGEYYRRSPGYVRNRGSRSGSSVRSRSSSGDRKRSPDGYSRRNGGNGIGSPDRFSDAITLEDVAKKSKASWKVSLVMKTSRFGAELFLLKGVPEVTRLLSVEANKTMRITQRLHTLPAKLEEIRKSLERKDSAIFLVLAKAGEEETSKGEGGTEEEDDGDSQSGGSVQKPFQNLVSYLKKKDAAGVAKISDGEGNEGAALMYAFYPGSFSKDLLKRCAKDADAAVREDYLAVAIIKGTD